jgi:hypothetical protein
MVYVCNKCKYTTTLKFNYDRHITRKRPCTKDEEHHNSGNIENPSGVTFQQQNPSGVTFQQQNPSGVTFQKQNPSQGSAKDAFTCLKCTRVFKLEKYMNAHHKICKGVLPLQCINCKKLFNNRAAKHRHIKKGDCNAYTITNQNITNVNTTLSNCYNTINNTTNNIVNNTIQLINFDDYTIEHLDLQEFKRVCSKAMSSEDILQEYITKVFFNPHYPEYKSIRVTNLRADHKYMNVFNNARWRIELQSRVFGRIIRDSFKLVQQLNKEKNPSNSSMLIEIEDDDKEYDALDSMEKYERKMLLNYGKCSKRLADVAKQVVYNNCKV